MKERPIIFSGPMVRAILDGRKTQTRRVVRDPEYYGCTTGDCPHEIQRECDEFLASQAPYRPGDRLYVREAFGIEPERYIQPELDSVGGIFQEEVFYRADDPNLAGMKWRPSIHMPKWAARIWLEVTGVRVERLQDISSKDIEAEGIAAFSANKRHVDFLQLWNGLNAKRGYGWDANPWVWVIEFRRSQ